LANPPQDFAYLSTTFRSVCQVFSFTSAALANLL
jgi:hypothetical protein